MLRRLRELNPALIRRLAHRLFFAVNKIDMVGALGRRGGWGEWAGRVDAGRAGWAHAAQQAHRGTLCELLPLVCWHQLPCSL